MFFCSSTFALHFIPRSPKSPYYFHIRLFYMSLPFFIWFNRKTCCFAFTLNLLEKEIWNIYPYWYFFLLCSYILKILYLNLYAPIANTDYFQIMAGTYLAVISNAFHSIFISIRHFTISFILFLSNTLLRIWLYELL